jgi:hypothetical protein
MSYGIVSSMTNPEKKFIKKIKIENNSRECGKP